jgi:hypothetical protein
MEDLRREGRVVVSRRMYGKRKAWAVAMGEINKNGDLHVVSRVWRESLGGR